MLTGYRGSDPVDLAALTDIAWRLSALADDLAEIHELNLRPVLAGPAGAVVTGTSRGSVRRPAGSTPPAG